MSAHHVRMSPWVSGTLVVIGMLAASVVLGIVGGLWARHRLRALFADREPAGAFATCAAAFEGMDSARVQLAYRWVQQLVDFPEAPLCAGDDLWRDLRLDQGTVDNELECSHQWRGEDARDELVEQKAEPRTVEDLMAQLLAWRYEGYAAVTRS
jgi:hypothetical protein